MDAISSIGIVRPGNFLDLFEYTWDMSIPARLGWGTRPATQYVLSIRFPPFLEDDFKNSEI